MGMELKLNQFSLLSMVYPFIQQKCIYMSYRHASMHRNFTFANLMRCKPNSETFQNNILVMLTPFPSIFAISELFICI